MTSAPRPPSPHLLSSPVIDSFPMPSPIINWLHLWSHWVTKFSATQIYLDASSICLDSINQIALGTYRTWTDCTNPNCTYLIELIVVAKANGNSSKSLQLV